jgi:hypothetical protein
LTTQPGAARIQSAVTRTVEAVFSAVDEVHAAALRCHEEATAGGAAALLADPFAGIQGPVRALLAEPGQLAVGLGMIVAPRSDSGLPGDDGLPGRTELPVHLEWWQLDPASDLVLALDPDLRPSSLGFYDYASADWFDVPRRTGRRHVVGPYVDVHGTGRYLLTLTTPVVVDGRFLGVVGADVPVSAFESRLLRELGPHDGAFVLVDDEDRVVLSTSPRWLTGCFWHGDAGSPDPLEPVPHLPWRLLVTERPDFLVPSPAHPYVHRTRPRVERNAP